jgi:hypothetical protein
MATKTSLSETGITPKNATRFPWRGLYHEQQSKQFVRRSAAKCGTAQTNLPEWRPFIADEFARRFPVARSHLEIVPMRTATRSRFIIKWHARASLSLRFGACSRDLSSWGYTCFAEFAKDIMCMDVHSVLIANR